VCVYATFVVNKVSQNYVYIHAANYKYPVILGR